MAKVPSIEHTFYYRASRARVFAALTEPDQLARWFVDKAAITPKKGAPFRFRWKSYTLRGRVRSVDPPGKLVLTWVDRFGKEKPLETEARIELHRHGPGTRLTLTHRGFRSGKKWIALYGAIEAGWAYYLTNLRSVLEHGTDLRSDLDVLG